MTELVALPGLLFPTSQRRVALRRDLDRDLFVTTSFKYLICLSTWGIRDLTQNSWTKIRIRSTSDDVRQPPWCWVELVGKLGLFTITGTSADISTPGKISNVPFFSSIGGTVGDKGCIGSQQSVVSPSVTRDGRPLTSSRGVPVPLLASELLPPLLQSNYGSLGKPFTLKIAKNIRLLKLLLGAQDLS